MVNTAPARRPGRPPGSTPAEILEVAREALLASGFSRTTMDVVAKKAGISKATLYRSFPSKDDLYRAVVTDWVDRGADAMRPHVSTLLTAKDLRNALLNLARTMQAGILSPDVLAMRSLVSTEAARHPDIAIIYATNSWERNTAMLGEALAELHDRGTLNIPDPGIAADQFTWLVVGSPLNQHELTAGAKTMPANRLSDIATAAVEAFMAAYAP